MAREIAWLVSYRFVEEISDALAAMRGGTFDRDQQGEAMAVDGVPARSEQQARHYRCDRSGGA